MVWVLSLSFISLTDLLLRFWTFDFFLALHFILPFSLNFGPSLDWIIKDCNRFFLLTLGFLLLLLFNECIIFLEKQSQEGLFNEEQCYGGYFNFCIFIGINSNINVFAFYKKKIKKKKFKKFKKKSI